MTFNNYFSMNPKDLEENNMFTNQTFVLSTSGSKYIHLYLNTFTKSERHRHLDIDVNI